MQEKYTKDFILKNVSLENKLESYYWNEQPLMEEFSFDFHFIQEMDRISKVPFVEWLCTDTYVGIHVYFLDDKPVCITSQRYRKSDEEFYWLSEEGFKKTKEYIKSLIKEEDVFSILKDDFDFEPLVDHTGEYIKYHYKK